MGNLIPGDREPEGINLSKFYKTDFDGRPQHTKPTAERSGAPARRNKPIASREVFGKSEGQP